jgi:hypothetical protein
LICQAVEKYVAGADPEEAAQVEGATVVDTSALTRSIIKGDWSSARTLLYNSAGLDVRAVRVSIIKYLRAILLESASVETRSAAVAEGIRIFEKYKR